MTPDQERALALARARRRREEATVGGGAALAPQQATEATESRPGGLQIVNEGIARGLGAPVDFTTWLVNSGLIDGVNALTGSDLGHITDPVGGSASIRRGFEGLGTDFAGGDFQPEGVGENFLLGTGNAAGGILPGVGIGKALQAGGSLLSAGESSLAPAGGLVEATGSFLAHPAATAPLRAAASELAAGGGAGVGMDVANELAPDNPVAQMAGAAIGGGMMGAGPYIAGQTVKRLPLVSTAAKVIQNEVAPFTEAGALERARRRMSGLVEDPQAAIANLKTPTISNQSPAVSTGDRRMMALERTVRDQDPAIDMRMRQTEAEGSDALRQAMTEPGQGVNSSVARDYMEGAVQQQVDGVGQALDDTFGAPVPNATAMADLRKSTAPARRSAYDVAYDTPIDYASDTGRNLTALLDRVEKAAPGVIKLANRLMAGEGAQSQQILADVADDGTVTYMRMPDTQQIDYITRALNHMAKSGDGNGALGGQTDLGRVVSGLSKQIRGSLRDANPMYGPALESAATPLAQRDALQFGQELLKPGMHRDVAAAQIADMTEPELAALRQSVRAQLDEQLANVRMSNSNPDTGMREAQQAMTQLSSRAVREKIGMLFPDEQDQALFQQMDSATAMLDPRRSGVARYASARPDEEIRSIMSSPNPRVAAEQLVAQAGADPTGQALPSVKGSFIGELMSRARSGTFDENGQAVLSGRALRAALNDTRVSPVATAVLNAEERSRLNTIVEELTRAETAGGRLPNVGNVMEGEPNTIISLVARMLAARVGATVGHGAHGASLQTAAMASKGVKGLLRKLTLDKAEGLIKQAVTGDRELFEALLTPAERWTPKQEGRLFDVLSTTISGTSAAAVGQAGMGTEEDQEIEEEDAGYGDPVIDAVMAGRKPAGPSRMDMDVQRYLETMM